MSYRDSRAAAVKDCGQFCCANCKFCLFSPTKKAWEPQYKCTRREIRTVTRALCTDFCQIK